MLSTEDKEMYEAIIQRYVRDNKEEFEAWTRDMELKREDMKDEEFGSTKGKNGDFRLVMNMPSRLFKMLAIYNPKVLETKEDHADFLAEFPGFQLAEKI
jgi:hypothetical protein